MLRTTKLILLITLLIVSYSRKTQADTVSYNIYPETDISEVKPVTISFDGKLYAESWWFDEITNHVYSPNSEEIFVMNLINAYANASSSELINYWPPDERSDVSALINDQSMFDANQVYYKSIKYSAFILKVSYGTYSVYFIQQQGDDTDKDVNVYPIITQDGNHYVTNKLQDDATFAYMATVIKDKIALKARPVAP